MQDILFDHVAPSPEWRPPVSDAAGPGGFFVQTITLPAGRLAIRAQIMTPADPPPGATVTITLRHAGQPYAPPLASTNWRGAADTPGDADHLYLACDLPAETLVELHAYSSHAVGAFRMRAVTVRRGEIGAPASWTHSDPGHDTWPLPGIRNVIIGNSGICTASCGHCPTNKPWLDVPATRVMSDHIFERIVTGLVDCGLPIGCIGMGLFGDPMTDRKLTERVLRLKSALPDVPVTISTTGAAYAARHQGAIEAAHSVAVHIESIDPETYARLMAPLRLDKVRPRIEALVAAAPGKAILAVPIHRDSLPGLPALEHWWRDIGGHGQVHQLFSNRLQTLDAVQGLHLAPVPGVCGQDLVSDLVIDWDGLLLTCCSDFARRKPLGSLADNTLPEVLADERRRMLFHRLRQRDWQSVGLCRSCLFDDAWSSHVHVVLTQRAAHEAGQEAPLGEAARIG
jgi:hypothetical protein